MGDPQVRWMRSKSRENPKMKWMRTGCSPILGHPHFYGIQNYPKNLGGHSRSKFHKIPVISLAMLAPGAHPPRSMRSWVNCGMIGPCRDMMAS